LIILRSATCLSLQAWGRSVAWSRIPTSYNPSTEGKSCGDDELMVERRSKGARPFSLEELVAWWESEGTLALLPKGCTPDRTCLKAQFAITQIAPIMFHKGIHDALVRHCGIDERACFVYKDRVIMRNPREIRKVIETFKPLVRLRGEKHKPTRFHLSTRIGKRSYAHMYQNRH